MVVITHQRDKCIGCNYCVELAFDQWRMSKKDGKATLLNAENKRGFHTLRTNDHETYNNNVKAAEACPVNIIKVKIV
ncbi:MAG: ferredoxin [Fluviicola sp. XM-24bin1]|nr:MAG: ferredoxin [Fluviicola sp. XM-24bin1]